MALALTSCLLLAMHASAVWWQAQEARFTGSTTKTGHVAFAGAAARTILFFLSTCPGAIAATGSYWDQWLVPTLYEVLAHWALRHHTSPNFKLHLFGHHVGVVIYWLSLKAAEFRANIVMPPAITLALWLFESASGASDAWWVVLF